MKRYVTPIEGERIRLRPIEAIDLSLTLVWRNQEQIRKWFFHSDIITPNQHYEWFEGYQTRDDDLTYIIETPRPGCRPIGQVALYHIDWSAGQAEFGRLMIGDQESIGKGLAFAATTLLVNNAFLVWGLQEVYLKVFAHNEVAIAIYKKCGFETLSSINDILIMSKKV